MNNTEIAFSKMEGCGNSFVVVFEKQASDRGWAALAKRICDHGFGIGSDGLMLIRPSSSADFDVNMFNPDGSSMGMCGNGIRCVSRYLLLHGLSSPVTQNLSFNVEGRSISCEFKDSGRLVKVDMGEPSFSPEDLPVACQTEFVNQPISTLKKSFMATCVSMGNPHCVIFDENADQVDLKSFGSQLENHQLFPKRTNVEFVKIINREHLGVYVWERGAGITLACGTGACASVVAGAKLGYCARNCQVTLPGGKLEIFWDSDTNRVYLTGPAREICTGTLAKEF